MQQPEVKVKYVPQQYMNYHSQQLAIVANIINTYFETQYAHNAQELWKKPLPQFFRDRYPGLVQYVKDNYTSRLSNVLNKQSLEFVELEALFANHVDSCEVTQYVNDKNECKDFQPYRKDNSRLPWCFIDMIVGTENKDGQYEPNYLITSGRCPNVTDFPIVGGIVKKMLKKPSSMLEAGIDHLMNLKYQRWYFYHHQQGLLAYRSYNLQDIIKEIWRMGIPSRDEIYKTHNDRSLPLDFQTRYYFLQLGLIAYLYKGIKEYPRLQMFWESLQYFNLGDITKLYVQNTPLGNANPWAKWNDPTNLYAVNVEEIKALRQQEAKRRQRETGFKHIRTVEEQIRDEKLRKQREANQPVVQPPSKSKNWNLKNKLIWMLLWAPNLYASYNLYQKVPEERRKELESILQTLAQKSIPVGEFVLEKGITLVQNIPTFVASQLVSSQNITLTPPSPTTTTHSLGTTTPPLPTTTTTPTTTTPTTPPLDDTLKLTPELEQTLNVLEQKVVERSFQPTTTFVKSFMSETQLSNAIHNKQFTLTVDNFFVANDYLHVSTTSSTSSTTTDFYLIEIPPGSYVSENPLRGEITFNKYSVFKTLSNTSFQYMGQLTMPNQLNHPDVTKHQQVEQQKYEQMKPSKNLNQLLTTYASLLQTFIRTTNTNSIDTTLLDRIGNILNVHPDQVPRQIIQLLHELQPLFQPVDNNFTLYKVSTSDQFTFCTFQPPSSQDDLTYDLQLIKLRKGDRAIFTSSYVVVMTPPEQSFFADERILMPTLGEPIGDYTPVQKIHQGTITHYNSYFNDVSHLKQTLYELEPSVEKATSLMVVNPIMIRVDEQELNDVLNNYIDGKEAITDAIKKFKTDGNIPDTLEQISQAKVVMFLTEYIGLNDQDTLNSIVQELTQYETGVNPQFDSQPVHTFASRLYEFLTYVFQYVIDMTTNAKELLTERSTLC